MKRKNLLLAVSAGLATNLFANNLKAQENPVHSLDDVVITAARTPKKQSETGKVVRVITAEKLAQSQGRSLSQVLNEVAGITIGGSGNNPGDIKTVYMRGANAGNTLILIDNIAVNDASGISGEFNFASIPIDQIERIEILKGGNSTLYGSDAVAGVINIITKKGIGKLNTSFLATAGSYKNFKQALSLNGQIERTSVAINFSNQDADNFSTSKSANEEFEFESDPSHQKGLNVNIGQQITDHFVLRSLIQTGTASAQLDYGAFTDATGYDYQKNTLLAAVSGTYDPGKMRIDFNISENKVKNLFNDNNSITNNKGDILTAEANITYPVGSFLNVISGFNLKHSSTEQINPYSSALYADNNINSIFTSAFLKTNSGFNFELGGRYNKHSVYGDNFTYTINPSYVIDSRYKIYFNLSSAYKIPSLYQLFSEYGNLALRPENSKSYEAGFDLDLIPSKLNINLNSFVREIENVIDFGQLQSGKYAYINQNQQKDKGFEFEVGFKPASVINLTAYYAYVEGNQINDANTVNNLFRIPKNSVGATADLILSKAFDLNFSYKFSGSRTDRYFDNDTFELKQSDLSSYHLLNTHLQFKPSAKLILFTEVQNILNQDYVEFAGYNTMGINFNSGLRLTL